MQSVSEIVAAAEVARADCRIEIKRLELAHERIAREILLIEQQRRRSNNSVVVLLDQDVQLAKLDEQIARHRHAQAKLDVKIAEAKQRLAEQQEIIDSSWGRGLLTRLGIASVALGLMDLTNQNVGIGIDAVNYKRPAPPWSILDDRLFHREHRSSHDSLLQNENTDFREKGYRRGHHPII
jgi:hypothetical protein